MSAIADVAIERIRGLVKLIMGRDKRLSNQTKSDLGYIISWAEGLFNEYRYAKEAAFQDGLNAGIDRYSKVYDAHWKKAKDDAFAEVEKIVKNHARQSANGEAIQILKEIQALRNN